MSDKWLILVIILIILVIFSFDYQARINRNSIRIFFEEYEYPKNGILGLLEGIFCLRITKNIGFTLVRGFVKSVIC